MLTKTTILPSDEKSLAREMFRELVYEKACVLFVVLGKGGEAETTANRADTLAGSQDEWRWVCWARKPEHIADDVAALTGAEAIDLGGLRAFVLSLSDEIRHVIPITDPVPDLARIFDAYVEAEANGR